MANVIAVSISDDGRTIGGMAFDPAMIKQSGSAVSDTSPGTPVPDDTNTDLLSKPNTVLRWRC